MELCGHISKHEKTSGGMLECTDSVCDLNYYCKHDKLQNKVETFFEDFRKLKSEFFNYAGGILEGRKP